MYMYTYHRDSLRRWRMPAQRALAGVRMWIDLVGAELHLQGYLAYKKTPSRRTLP